MKNPQGTAKTWVQAEGGNGGDKNAGTAVELGTQSGVQRREAEDEGYQVWETYRWTVHCAKRGVGEWV